MKLTIKRIAHAALITSVLAVAGSAFAMASSNVSYVPKDLIQAQNKEVSSIRKISLKAIGGHAKYSVQYKYEYAHKNKASYAIPVNFKLGAKHINISKQIFGYAAEDINHKMHGLISKSGGAIHSSIIDNADVKKGSFYYSGQYYPRYRDEIEFSVKDPSKKVKLEDLQGYSYICSWSGATSMRYESKIAFNLSCVKKPPLGHTITLTFHYKNKALTDLVWANITAFKKSYPQLMLNESLNSLNIPRDKEPMADLKHAAKDNSSVTDCSQHEIIVRVRGALLVKKSNDNQESNSLLNFTPDIFDDYAQCMLHNNPDKQAYQALDLYDRIRLSEGRSKYDLWCG